MFAASKTSLRAILDAKNGFILRGPLFLKMDN
jgi:hypothetical protein